MLASKVHVHDPRHFYLDLTYELRRRALPKFPQREFWNALEFADRLDCARAIQDRNSEDDADYFEDQHSFEMLESDRDPDPRYYNMRHAPKTAQQAAHPRMH
jgi:hypothetical protein